MSPAIPDLEAKFIEYDPRNLESKARLEKVISNHHFNNKIILHLPDTPSIPSFTKDVLQNSSFYSIHNITIHELINFKFLQAFVKNGKFYGYSINTRLDIDNCAAFLPTGHLFLLLNSSDYHKLGISGKLSSHILRTPNHKYIVKIDTNAPGFIAGKKLYQRTMNVLSSCSFYFDFYIQWLPNDVTVCPSSVAKYFHDKGYSVKEVDTSMSQFLLSDLQIPLFADIGSNNPSPQEALEWLGLTALDIDPKMLELEESSYCSSTSLFISHIEGFFTPSLVVNFLSKAKDWLMEQNENDVPWLCLTVYGPNDCLISWSHSENSYKVNGDNFYSIIIRRDKLTLFTVEEDKKPLRERPKAH